MLLDAKQKGWTASRAVALAGLGGRRAASRADGRAHPRPTAGAVRPGGVREHGEGRRPATARPGGSGTTRCSSATSGGSSRDEPRFAPLGLGRVQGELVEANRADLLTLSRADLVQVMDPADVRESETTYLNAVFHFVLVEKE